MYKIKGMSCKKLITITKIRQYQISSGILCQYKQVISVLNFSLKILAVDEKIAINFRWYFFAAPCSFYEDKIRIPAAKRFWCIFGLKSAHILSQFAQWHIRNYYCTFWLCITPRPTCQNWLILLLHKSWHNKITVGRLERGIAPTTFWPRGRSPPWSRRLWCQQSAAGSVWS